LSRVLWHPRCYRDHHHPSTMPTSSLSSSFARSFVVFQARDDDALDVSTSFPKTKRAMDDDDFDEDSRVNDDNNDENAR